MIQVESFVKVYRDVTAVDSLSFAVAPGEVLGLREVTFAQAN